MSATTVTKSVRLSPEESEELARLSAQTSVAEAALMRRWIQEGMRAKKIELAIQAYQERKTDLRAAAAMADVSYNRFLREIERRNVVVLDGEGFLEGLAALAEALDDDTLRHAVNTVATEP
ncbi:MAG TPA: hypothetical protein VER55_11330 [Ardenticatenaceae bacterium]|nr:hypothetical protein [Ardenticatenaceae bacterium]